MYLFFSLNLTKLFVKFNESQREFPLFFVDVNITQEQHPQSSAIVITLPVI